MVFSHVIQGRPGGLFQLSGGGAVRIILASTSSYIRAMCPKYGKMPRLDYHCEVRLLLVLLRFQNVSCRSVSLGFAEKTSVFGSVKVFMINAL